MVRKSIKNHNNFLVNIRSWITKKIGISIPTFFHPFPCLKFSFYHSLSDVSIIYNYYNHIIRSTIYLSKK